MDQTSGLVSKETVVLRRWGRETQNFVDNQLFFAWCRERPKIVMCWLE